MDDDKRVQNIILYLLSHYQSELTLDSIAREFATNRTTLNIIFKRSAGCTVIRFLRNIRIHMAARLLLETGLNVSEIGFEAGFQDISNFGKVFRQKFGCTPSALRRMVRKAGWEEEACSDPAESVQSGSRLAV